MRQSYSVVLVGTFLSAAAPVSANNLPRGVGPEFAKYFESKDSFTCITHPEIKLSVKQINDNTCDCPDGSDEPGTSACAHLDPLSPPQPFVGSKTGTTSTTTALPGFWCANEGHIGAYVPFMYVNDGHCDYDICCDGTEEYGKVGGVKCPNKCNEIGKEFRRVEAERKAAIDKAGKRRKTMAKESRELRRRVEVKVNSLKEEVKNLETKKEELEQKLHETERSERGKVVKGEGSGGKLGTLVNLAKSRVAELRETLEDVVAQRDDLRNKVGELEGILRRFKEEYNPNFNDEGVKRAVKGFEDYSANSVTETKSDDLEADIREVLVEDNESSGINWKEFEEAEGSDTDILYNFEAYLPAPAREFVRDKVTAIRGWLIDNGLMVDNTPAGSESRLVTVARDAFNAANNDLNEKRRQLENEEKDLEKDYGTDDIFRVLSQKCVSTEAGEYEYELCWMDKTNQKSKKGHGNTNMGNFVRIDREMADDEERTDGKSLGKGLRMVMRFENGQGCWNGPQRRTDVWLACSETEELWKVSESEKCVYKMEVGTPAACDDLLEPPEPKSKDEL
ncbi:Glucosidase 2 subunit beta [Colletotrichum sp. SAR11_59]|uniref:Glucosidase 2 subunit beta n=1 Tax=Colletotrichum asianum TaxID=702518 RepID=A0A8H3ZLW1_9PEZI|nr:Glucosidase 2 subunit beta [Colletotrichum aenigma]KAF0318506.1 glucosidase II beta subunit-like protein [Colletotrichum asianum]KAF4871007.1 Glucosidase 2 subunit beta [Colletotrichum siamense]KAI8215074.1 Glucosidase 2 subunit beta [Colletotrichum sp. SAR 10_76]KAI8248334.1 Glucosidase 2 subunit beta [Colletotrichum sp. SAR 10_77]KAI8306268.1 Glucosidase 2 subunit beta [Colletotrichum sp. SAR11_59]KAI8317416.1 Glucosidase 2 subunit beta [Colletotrichum sp. SAR11_240]KAJ5008319.1 Glucosi